MVVVLNFGSQFAHLIARRVRDLGVKAEILPFDILPRKLRALQPQGIILSGSPASVLEKKSPRPSREIFSLGIPVLGVCYGEQVMADILGGHVKSGRREFGEETLSIHAQSELFRGLKARETVWFSHGDQVVRLPNGFKRVASTVGCHNAGIADIRRRFWGIQFHPEVTHTVRGREILANFLFRVCGTRRDWRVSRIAPQLISSLRERLNSEFVLIGLSGGVDSLVAATLLSRAIEGNLHALMVDTGLLRNHEVEEVHRAVKRQKLQNFRIIDASTLFLRRLRGVVDPERKRTIIGHTFIEVFEKYIKRELKKHRVRYFAQGTIYPDRIESAEPSRYASKIKSHHNLTLPEKFGFKIIEPLRDFYKDEVRVLGRSLGLPEQFLMRHPFPGPGLSVRIVGEVTPERLRILRAADAIYIEELRKTGEYEKIWQAFAVLLPLKSVGVMGDARTYEYMISLRAVDSVDGMSADWHKFPPSILERVAHRIVGEVRGVNRVLYDVTQKPPATIEYE